MSSDTFATRRSPWRRAYSFEWAFGLTLAGSVLAAILAGALPAPVRVYAQPLLAAAVLAGGFVWRPAAGLLAFAIFVLGYDTLALYVGNAVKRTDEIAIPAIALITLVRYRPWRSWQWSLVRDGGIALFVAAGIAASLINSVPITIWAPALVLVMKPVVVFYVAMSIPIDRTVVFSGARVVLALGITVAALGLVEALDPGAFQRAIGLPEWVRPRGILPSIKSIFTHPAIFAWFMSFLALYSFIGYVHLRRRWLLVAGFMFGVATFMTARRRAIAAAFGTIGLAFAWTVRRPRRIGPELRRWAPVFAACALMIVAFIPGIVGLYDRTVDRYLPGETPAIGEPVGEAPPDDEGPATTPARVALYRGSLEIARDHFPVGAGMGRYGSWMSRIEYSPVYREYGLDSVRGLTEHNSQYATDTFWPMILGEFGVIGAAGYVAFLAGVGIPLWRAGRLVPDPMSAVFVVGGLAVFTQALIESIATPMFTSPPRSYLLFVAIGSAIAVWGSARQPSSGQEDRGPGPETPTA